MAVTPLLYATANTQPNGTWTNPGNITGPPNSVFATWVNATSGGTAAIAGQGFDVASMVPAGSTITGVSATVKAYCSSTTNISSLTVRLYNGSTTIGAAVTGLRSATTTYSQVINFPTMPTAADIAANDLRVRVIPVRAANTTSSTFYVDSIGLQITYTPPPPTTRYNVEDITSLTYRWRADSINAANGSAVGSWPALVGGAGAALTQATAASKPVLVTSGIGGKPSVRFDGVDDRINVGLTSLNQPHTVVLVAKSAVVGSAALQPLDASNPQLLTGTSSGWISWEGSANIEGGTATTNPTVVTAFGSGASSSLWQDGAQVASGNAGTGPIGQMMLGDYSGGTGRTWAGDIAEVLVFNSSLSTDERASVHSYVQDRYGITIAASEYLAPLNQDFSGSLALSAPGTLTLTAASVATSGSLSLSGSGAQSLPAGKLAVNTSLTLNGSGTATWTGKPGWASSVPLAGSGQMDLSNAKFGFRGPDTAFSGSGSLAFSAARIVVGPVAVPLGGSSGLGITPTRIVVPKTGSIPVTLAGVGTVGIVGKPGFSAAVALSSGAVQLQRTPVKVASTGSLTFSGVGTLEVNDPNSVPVYVFTDQGVWRPIKALRLWNGRSWLNIHADHFRIH